MMSLRLPTLPTVACFLALVSTAAAQDHRPSDEEACSPDVFRLCASEIPNETAIVACLNAQLANLSPACHAVMAPRPVKPARKKRRIRHG